MPPRRRRFSVQKKSKPNEPNEPPKGSPTGRAPNFSVEKEVLQVMAGLDESIALYVSAVLHSPSSDEEVTDIISPLVHEAISTAAGSETDAQRVVEMLMALRQPSPAPSSSGAETGEPRDTNIDSQENNSSTLTTVSCDVTNMDNSIRSASGSPSVSDPHPSTMPRTPPIAIAGVDASGGSQGRRRRRVRAVDTSSATSTNDTADASTNPPAPGLLRQQTPDFSFAAPQQIEEPEPLQLDGGLRLSSLGGDDEERLDKFRKSMGIVYEQINPTMDPLDVANHRLDRYRRQEDMGGVTAAETKLNDEELAQQEEDLRNGPPEMVLAKETDNNGSSTDEPSIRIENFTLYAGDKSLFENTSLKLQFGRRYGLVGRNGGGKTTLLRELVLRNSPQFYSLAQFKIVGVQQELPSSSATVLQTVLESDPDRRMKLERWEALSKQIDETKNENSSDELDVNEEQAGVGTNSETNSETDEWRWSDLNSENTDEEDQDSPEGNLNDEWKDAPVELTPEELKLPRRARLRRMLWKRQLQHQEALKGTSQSTERNWDLEKVPDTKLDEYVQEAMEEGIRDDRAKEILTGLGFSQEMQEGSVDKLSGGWRMRVAIAAALFCEPDILLLDEPTNHLDLEAVVWLEKFLVCEFPFTVVIVSHDRVFLNNVCTDTIQVRQKRLIYYRGNYDAMIRTEVARNPFHDQKLWSHNQKKKMKYWDVISADLEQRVLQYADPGAAISLRFHAPSQIQHALIEVHNVSFGYGMEESIVDTGTEEIKGNTTLSTNVESSVWDSTDRELEEEWNQTAGLLPATSDRLLLKKVDMNVQMGSRIAIVGSNGAGKSTLLKLLLGDLTPTTGHIHHHNSLKIGLFTQHHQDKLTLTKSPLENMALHAEQSGKVLSTFTARTLLDRFGVPHESMSSPCSCLSGGQKSRVCMAILAAEEPHVFVFDEPTNHLDLHTVNALIGAIAAFLGAVLIVSHDQHFVSAVATQIYKIDPRTKLCLRYDGDFDDYKREIERDIQLRIDAGHSRKVDKFRRRHRKQERRQNRKKR